MERNPNPKRARRQALDEESNKVEVRSMLKNQYHSLASFFPQEISILEAPEPQDSWEQLDSFVVASLESLKFVWNENRKFKLSESGQIRPEINGENIRASFLCIEAAAAAKYKQYLYVLRFHSLAIRSPFARHSLAIRSPFARHSLAIRSPFAPTCSHSLAIRLLFAL
jgi:hypothetical protein